MVGMLNIHEILHPCSCGSKRIRFVERSSFLSRSVVVECASCHKITKCHFLRNNAINEWNFLNPVPDRNKTEPMSPAEAIMRIRDHFTHHKDLVPTPYLDEAVRMAIDALEKQIPKKVIIKNWMPALCPSCGARLSTHVEDGYYENPYGMKYCPECRQRLLWE